MASAKPVIMIAEGEAGDIVERNQAGLVVSPGDIQGIVTAIEILVKDPELRKKMGVNGRKAVLDNYSRNDIIQKFADFLKNTGD
jgi:glycosyltransferase involved in cell wall biosynthesis